MPVQANFHLRLVAFGLYSEFGNLFNHALEQHTFQGLVALCRTEYIKATEQPLHHQPRSAEGLSAGTPATKDSEGLFALQKPSLMRQKLNVERPVKPSSQYLPLDSVFLHEIVNALPTDLLLRCRFCHLFAKDDLRGGHILNRCGLVTPGVLFQHRENLRSGRFFASR